MHKHPIPTIFIRLRQSPCWDTLSRSQFQHQAQEFCKLIGRPRDLVIDIADLWDATFDIKYVEARSRIKAIATENLAAVANAELTSSQKPDTGRAGVFLFIDDDDWLCPNLAVYLSQFPIDDIDGFRWPSLAFDPSKECSLFTRPLPRRVYSNNYAVTSRYFHTHSLHAVDQHWRANETFKTLEIAQLPRNLSISNRHPASFTFLERLLANRFSTRVLANAVEMLSSRKLTPLATEKLGVIWVQDPIGKSLHFCKCLRASAKRIS